MSSWLTAVVMDVTLGAGEAIDAALNLIPISIAFGTVALVIVSLPLFQRRDVYA